LCTLYIPKADLLAARREGSGDERGEISTLTSRTRIIFRNFLEMKRENSKLKFRQTRFLLSIKQTVQAPKEII